MATAPIAALAEELRKRFPEAKLGGMSGPCRHIRSDPNRPWSQHSWGNAVDIAVPDSAYGWTVYAWLVTNKFRLNLSTICWQTMGGCNAADHQTHLHVSGSPKMKGVPPCASGETTKSKENWITDTLTSVGPFQALKQAKDLATGETPVGDVAARLLWGGAGVVLVIVGLVAMLKVLDVTIPTTPAAAAKQLVEGVLA